VRRLELVGDVELAEVDGQTRCGVPAVAETAERYRTTLGQTQRDDRRPALGDVERRLCLERLRQTAVRYDVDPLHWSYARYPATN